MDNFWGIYTLLARIIAHPNDYKFNHFYGHIVVTRGEKEVKKKATITMQPFRIGTTTQTRTGDLYHVKVAL
jgi:hypothetical protein